MSFSAPRLVLYKGKNEFAPFPTDAIAAAPPPDCAPDENDSITPNNFQPVGAQSLHPGAFCVWLGSAVAAPREVQPDNVSYDLVCDSDAPVLTVRIDVRNPDAAVAAVTLGLGRVAGAVVIKSWQTCDGVVLQPKIERKAKAQAMYDEACRSSRHNASLGTTGADAEYFEIGKVPAGARFSFHVVVRLASNAWLPEVSSSGGPRRSFCDVGVQLPVSDAASVELTVRVAESLAVCLPSHLVAAYEASTHLPTTFVAWIDPEAFRDPSPLIAPPRRVAHVSTVGLAFAPLFKVRLAQRAHGAELESALALLSVSSLPRHVFATPPVPSGTAALGTDDELVAMVASICRVVVPSPTAPVAKQKPLVVAIPVDSSGSMVYSSSPGYQENNERLSKRHACQILRTMQATTLPAMESSGLLHPEQEVLFTLVGFHSTAWEICARRNLRSADDVEAACAALLAPCSTGGTCFVSFADVLLASAKAQPAATETWAVLLLTDGGAADPSSFFARRDELGAHVADLAVSVLGFGAWVDAQTARAACTFGSPVLLEYPDEVLVRESLKLVPRMIVRLLCPRHVTLALQGDSQEGLEVLAVRAVGGPRPRVRLPSLLDGNCGLALRAFPGDEFEMLVRHPKHACLVHSLDGDATAVGYETSVVVGEDDWVHVEQPRVEDAVAHLALIDPLFVSAAAATELVAPKSFETERKEHIVHVAKRAGLISSETSAVAVVLAEDLVGPPKEAIPVKGPVLKGFADPFLGTRSCLPPCYRSLAAGDDDATVFRSMGAEVDPADGGNLLVAAPPPPMTEWIAAACYANGLVTPDAWRAAASSLLVDAANVAAPAFKKPKVDAVACLDAALAASPIDAGLVAPSNGAGAARLVATFAFLFPGVLALPPALPASEEALRTLLARMVAASEA